MMNKRLSIYAAIIVALLSSSCQKFLDQNPVSTLEINIDTEEKIAEILTAAYPEASYIPFLEPRTDNVMERPKGIYSRLNESMYFWEDYDQEDLDTPLNYWNACYSGIAQVNVALELLAPYEKTERVKALYGEAFLLRAYLHFMLANIWCEPYSPTTADEVMGIPYLTKPEKHALVDYSRGTLAEVYKQIERDLKLGITLVNDRYYKHPKYHFNKRAAYAFASRFYLITGEWDLVVKYADYVLGYNPRKWLRNWPQERDDIQGLPDRYNAPESPSVLLVTATESRLARQLPTDRYGTTHQKIDEIFNRSGIDGAGSDYKKLKWEMVFPFIYTVDGIGDVQYIPKFREQTLFGTGGTRPRGVYVPNTLFSTEEVMLNRIEALAMLKEYDRAVADLIEYMVTKLNWTSPIAYNQYLWTDASNYYVYAPFYGLTLKQLALVKIVVDLRRKEFLHEGMRWFDIRRFHMSVSRNSSSPLYHKLEADDDRKVLQIPTEAIQRGLKPNPRAFNHAGYEGNLPQIKPPVPPTTQP